MSKLKDVDKRSKIEQAIQEVVQDNFYGFNPLEKLLQETAAHESHFGSLSENIMQVDPGERETLEQEQYQPQLAHMGAKYTKEGHLDLSDVKTNIIV